MEKPNIEKEIKKHGNLISGVSAFLGLGSAAISAVNASPLATLMLCGAMIPFIIDAVTLKVLIEKPKTVHHDIWFIQKPFKKNVSKWIKSYIDNSESLTEKKYKVGCLSLWMKHEGIDVDKVMNTGIFKELSEELANKKEVEKYFPLHYLFGDYKSTIKDIYGIDPTFHAFLERDKEEPHKLEIAKEVYKEYSKLGMAGTAFLSRNNYEGLLILQGDKFTQEDYIVIANYLQNIKKNKREYQMSMINVELYSNESIRTLNKIIENEDNINNLKTLKDYTKEVLLPGRSDFSDIIELAEKRIDYLQLDSQLEIKNMDNKHKPKKMKI
jgi:hypothetical protein